MPNLGNHVDAIFIPESVNTSTTLKINGGDLNVNNGQFFVDQSTTNVGIGTTQPQHLLDIWGDGPDTAQLTLRQWNDNNGPGSVGDGPDIRFIASGGTIASPAEMDNDDVIGKVNAFAYDGTSSVQYGGFGWRYHRQGALDGFNRGSSFSIETKSIFETSNSAKISITEEGNIGVGENHFTPFRTVMINGSYNTSTSEYGAPDVWLVNSLSSASSGTNLGSIVFSRSTGSTGASAKIQATATGTDNETDLYFYNRTSGGGDNVNNILNTTPTLKLYHDKTAEFASDVNLPDDAKLLLGTDDDFQIYYDGSNSYIEDVGPGQFYIRGSAAIHLENTGGTQKYARFLQNGAAELYHNGTKAFETTSTGIDVPLGTITGPATLNIDPAAVGDNTGTVVIKGDLQVDGTTTTINSTTLTVDDKNIVLASGAADSAAANGAGITIDGANESLTWNDNNEGFSFSTRLQIGSAGSKASTLRLSKDLGGESIATYYAILNNGFIQPDVTGSAYYNYVQVKTDGNSGTAYTINNVEGYTATVGGSSINADSTITNLTAFHVRSTWTGGTNNYGFRGRISADTNRWNVYMDGSAPNYFAGNVGIGTVSPGYELQVSNGNSTTISIEASADDTSARAARLVYTFSDGDGASINATRATSDTAADVDLSFRTGGITNSEERLRITSGGNVGIGTDDPSTKLEVNGSITATGTGAHVFGSGNNTTTINPAGPTLFHIASPNGAFDGILLDMDDDQGENNFYALNIRLSDNPQGHTDNTNTKFLVNAEGNLLINYGTTLDTGYWLDVNGISRFAGDVSVSTDLKVIVGSDPSTSGNRGIKLSDNGTAGDGLVVAARALGANRLWQGFGASGGASTETSFINSDGGAYFGNFVGINTSAPETNLSIHTSANWNFPPVFLRRTASNTANNIKFIAFGLQGDTYSETTAANSTFIGLNVNSAPTTGDTVLSENARLNLTSPGGVIMPVGAVGIGTTNPNAKLRVDWDRTETFGFHLVQTTDNGEPDAMAITNNYDRDIGMVFRTGDSNGANQAVRWHIWNDGAVGGANNNRFNISPGTSNSVSNGITILQDSNVGMGTGSPTDKLHVVGSIKIEAGAPIIKLAETGVTGNPSWWIVQDAGNFSLRNNNIAPYAFNVATKGTNKDTTDFVSFGGDTIDDALKLTAHGTNPTYLDLKGNNANARMRYYEGATERWNIGYDIYTNAFTFYDVQSSAIRMLIYDNPNNGIVIGAADNGGLTWPSTDGGGGTVQQAALRVDGGGHPALFCYNDEQSGDPVAIFAKGNEADDNQVVIIAGDGDGDEELLDIRSSIDPPIKSSLLSFAQNNVNSKFRVYGDGRVYSSYRVGIGTTAPSSPLDVIGNFEFKSPDANDTGNTKIVGQFDGTGTRNTYLRIGANENRRASIVFSGVNTSTDASTDYWSIGRGDSDELNASSFFIATGESGGNTAKLVIDSNGDVGIGTTDPSAKLQVTTSNSTYLKLTSSTLGDRLIVDGTGQVGLDVPEANINARLHIATAGDVGILVEDILGGTVFEVDDGNGHVTVGNRLYIGGTTNYFSSQPSGHYGSVQINGSGKGNWEGYSIDGRAVFMHDGNTTMGLFDDVNNHWVLHHTMGGSSVTSLRSGNNVNTLTCTSNNQVGIGTATVARGPLHIHQGTTGDTQIHLTNSETGAASTDGFTIFTGGGDGSHSGFVNREPSARIRFLMHPSGGSSVTDQMVLLADGNLGLGISDPIDKLHVAGGDAYFDRRVGIGTTDNTSYALSIRNISTPTTTGGIFVGCHDWSTNASEYGINVDIDSTNRTNLTANRTHYGIRTTSNIRVATNASDTDGTRQSLYGIYGSAQVDDTDANDGKIYQLYGGYFRARADGVNVGNMRGVYALAQASDNATDTARTIDNLYGIYSWALNDGNETTFTNAYGVYSHVNQDDTGGAMTNAYGVYSRMDRDGGTAGTGYAFRGNFEGTWTTKYGVYMNGETINYFSGSVGIGTISPLSKLMVGSNDPDASSYITFGKRSTTNETNLPFIGHVDRDGDSQNDLGIGACSTGGSVIIYAGNSSPFTTGSERLRVAAGGNVGIGTTNPTQRLHVHGSSFFGGTTSSERATTIDTNGQGFFRYDDNNLTIPLTIENRGTNAVAGHGAAISFRFGDSSSNAAHDAGRISFLQENSWTSTSTTHDAKFVISLAQNDSLQDRFVIASNGTITAGSQEISGSGIEVGRGSGSVAMTINDGKGNANLTFNHRNGTPDNTSAGQSAGRIECGVDSTNARMYFELGDSTSNGTNVNLTNVMDLDIGVVNVTGDITASGNITAYSSDRRLKENLVRISTPLDKVDQLHGYTFDWKAECEDIGFIPKIQTNDMGLIAQDVQAVVPQAVAIAPFDHELSEDGTEDVSISGENYLTVQYDRLVPLLVEAIKELRQEVEALKAQISGS